MSGSIARITEPFGAFCATFRAAANVPPEEMPQKMPSFDASAREVWIASSSATGRISSATERSSTAGTKSGVQPWILCGLNSAPVSNDAPAGSVTTMRVSGRAFLMMSPAPVSVPPVPQPVTQKSSRLPAKSRRISGPVVLR